MRSVREAFLRTSRVIGGDPMPAARKTTTRTPAARSTSGAAASRPAATRRELERRVAQVEKHLEDAGEALQLLAKDLGRGAGDAYKELTRTARALRRDAQRTNQRMLTRTSTSCAPRSPLREPRGGRRSSAHRARTAPAPRPGRAGRPAPLAPAAQARPQNGPRASFGRRRRAAPPGYCYRRPCAGDSHIATWRMQHMATSRSFR